MMIAIDYDGTYTRDPELWEKFIDDCVKAKHRVVCFTMRFPSEPIDLSIEIVYTSRQPKSTHAINNGYKIDVWIDDHPEYI